MRIFPICLASLFCFGGAQFASAEVSFLLEADTLRDQLGDAVEITQGSWLLVADTTINGFGSVEPGTVSASDFIGGDDLIVARGTFWFVDGTIQSNPTGLSLGGGWDAGDPLALVWFPDAGTDPAAVDSGEEYGFYTSMTGEGGSSPWITPADGVQNYSLEIKTTDGGVLGTGPVDPSSVFASLTVVPEPSASLLGLLSALLLIRRRR